MKVILMIIAFMLLFFKSAAHSRSLTSDTAQLPAPFATESVKNFSKVIGWNKGCTPVAPRLAWLGTDDVNDRMWRVSAVT